MIKVVVADDEVKVCQLICGLIDWSLLDMEIVGVAHNGIEALDMIPTLQPDLMITDIRMPGYDGLEMISRAKKIKEDIDFIIVSGYRHFEYAQSAIKYGVCDYLLKPIKKEALLETLYKMRDKYRQRTQQLSSEERLKILLQSDIDKLRSNLFTNLLLQKGENKEPMEIQKLNKEYHFHLQPGYFQAFIVKVDCDYESLYQNGIKMLQEKVRQVLQSLLKEKCFDLEISFQASRAYCILNYPKDRQDLIRRQLKAAFDDLVIQSSIFENAKLTIGLGCVVEDLSQLEDSLKSAEWTICQRLMDGTGKLLEPSSAGYAPNTGSLLGELHKGMESAVEILDWGMAEEAIDLLKKQVMQVPKISGQEVFQLVTNAYVSYLMQLSNHQLLGGEMETRNDDFLRRADLCADLPQLFDLLKCVIQNSMESIVQDKKQEVKKPIQIGRAHV